jgi:hypothetical protein
MQFRVIQRDESALILPIFVLPLLRANILLLPLIHPMICVLNTGLVRIPTLRYGY